METSKKMKRKVPLGREDNVPSASKSIMDDLVSHMTKEKKVYFEEETDFFEN
ncbi:MAG: hypothetical protein IPK55_12385 [Streptococcus sp.]|nr:hypothetical protein [Streptococcus sp.]